jgi:hypothetical protein
MPDPLCFNTAEALRQANTGQWALQLLLDTKRFTPPRRIGQVFVWFESDIQRLKEAVEAMRRRGPGRPRKEPIGA